MRIAVTGSSGLIGPRLVTQLRADGHQVLRMVRRAPQAADEVRWNPRHAASGDATIGREAIAAALAGLQQRPALLLCSSGINWYGDTGARAVDESASGGSGFLADLAGAWEASTSQAEQAGITVAHMRTGVVLSRHGGMLGRLLLPFRLGLGARLGPGAQYISWIMLTDVVRAMGFLLDRQDIAGPVNLTAPHPTTNATFTAALARAVGRPAVFRLPSPVLRLALGEAAGELLASARVLPTRLLDAGYTFLHPDVESALANELRSR